MTTDKTDTKRNSGPARTPLPARRPALTAMVEARSVAVVGASPREGTLGQRMVTELARSPAQPLTYLVNPK
jgi:acetate---CoA ligase (ADP-forming)